MKQTFAFIALLAGCAAIRPTEARAQCNEACIPIIAPNGARGFGCVVDNDANAACIARSTGCFTKLCYNAVLTAPGGALLATADICGDKVTLHPVTPEQAPARVAVNAPRAQRAAVVAAKARAG